MPQQGIICFESLMETGRQQGHVVANKPVVCKPNRLVRLPAWDTGRAFAPLVPHLCYRACRQAQQQPLHAACLGHLNSWGAGMPRWFLCLLPRAMLTRTWCILPEGPAGSLHRPLRWHSRRLARRR